MSRPADLLALVQFPNNVADFQTAMGIPLWWDHLEQGRLFLLTNFADAAARLGGCTKSSQLSAHAATAIADIKSNQKQWHTTFKTPGWASFNTNQLRTAIAQRPMQLVKAAFALVTLEHCIRARADIDPTKQSEFVAQLYKDVRIVPAFYRLDGFDQAFYDGISDTQKDRCSEELLKQCALPKGHLVLKDLPTGLHVDYPVALCIQRILATSAVPLTIVTARRAAAGVGKGNVKPASKNLRYR